MIVKGGECQCSPPTTCSDDDDDDDDDDDVVHTKIANELFLDN